MKKNHCPYCNSTNLNCIPRKQWMHMLPGSRRVECLTCQAEFVTLMSRFVFPVSKGYSQLIKINELSREEH